MSTIGFNNVSRITNEDYKATQFQKAGKLDTKDNVVKEGIDGKISSQDLKGAIDSGQKDIFIARTFTSGTETKTVLLKINIAENKDKLNELMGKIGDSKEFNLRTAVTFNSVKEETGVEPPVTSTSKEKTPSMVVTDYQKKAETDAAGGKDPQYKALAEYPQNFITYDKKTGNITGSQLVADGETKVGKDNKLITSKAENPTQFTAMSDVILSDFNRYASPPLSKTYSNDDAGAQKFMESLKNIPGNSANANITLDNAKELLSYIHTGKNTGGDVNVKQLQGLLKGLTGTEGGNISDKNNPPGGDDKYGYATTLQVRSLAARIPQDILSGNPIMLVDTSGSMEKETKELTNTLGQLVNQDGKYRVGRFGDTAVSNDMQWKTDGDKTKTGNQAVDGKTALEALKNMTGGGSQESGIRAGLIALGSVEKSPTRENLLMFTDEGDKGLRDIGPLLKAAEDKNYKPVIVFHFDSGPNKDKYVAIDLSSLQEKIDTYNKDNGKNLTINSFKGGGDNYDIDWSQVVNTLKIPMADTIKGLKI